jgi:hypothetical protein
MTTTNKRYSYLRVAMIWIDVHPAEKTRSTRHTFFMLNPHRVLDHTSYVVYVGNLSLVSTRLKHASTPGRSLTDKRQTDPVIILGHLIPPPSRQSWSKWERFWPSGYTATSAYWTHILVYNRYVQCLLIGANPSVLNRPRRRLQP